MSDLISRAALLARAKKAAFNSELDRAAAIVLIKDAPDVDRICKHNTGVECFQAGRTCDKCGWNPEVRQARIDKIGKTKAGRRKREAAHET